MFEANYLAILVVAIVVYGLGALWYSPVLFGKKWMKLSGMSMDSAKGAGKGYAIGFIIKLVELYVLAYFVQMLGKNDFWGGAELGFWVWLGFVGTYSLGATLWERKPGALWWLNNIYNVIGLVIAGGILAIWM
ncbi:MAG: hypothetical protein COV31_03130 [Candidatus Yanofskybacteria bacterium CG10_big_fil_rev_8_21_14_0_10_46_23]|uniref:DUF1761 domain-containing protein n=1 Tax=Candidatus Yanofskybacteria bacterium CG10_big_fil_rev_8_21_14_0_10_46_23 TaxID=1975098 RepID=A0A2H0R3M2_9BACT|nr:MAG: hypothetical protein COV31_03130 [Candidatus Yanofskybacteria bacterium CG10_big_fil_rev_8_21_14_0_10_46_23]